jgi:hypothetical protein
MDSNSSFSFCNFSILALILVNFSKDESTFYLVLLTVAF